MILLEAVARTGSPQSGADESGMSSFQSGQTGSATGDTVTPHRHHSLAEPIGRLRTAAMRGSGASRFVGLEQSGRRRFIAQRSKIYCSHADAIWIFLLVPPFRPHGATLSSPWPILEDATAPNAATAVGRSVISAASGGLSIDCFVRDGGDGPCVPSP
jgi:hypothetical protein